MKKKNYSEEKKLIISDNRQTADTVLRGESIALRAMLIFSVLILLTALITGVLPSADDAQIYEKILRLHVIADSDDERAQQLKLMVRDSVLMTLGEKLEGCADLSDATAIALAETEAIRNAAEQTLRAEGCSDTVTVELGTEHYPTREYEGARLPAGNYNSLRVTIGSGSGQNWWCVLFPTMCTGAAAEPVEEFTDAGFTPGQVKVLTETEEPKYVLRFRFLEIIDEIKEQLFSKNQTEN